MTSGRCIAMWSGPRNISTAMMRAWENRPDTTVIDEPFYAHFLSHTGLDHPMRDEVIESGETDWRAVVDNISQAPSHGIVYQKHISTHWLEHFSTDWLDTLDHVFLIRQPEPVVASYAIKRDGLTPSDLGYSQQAALFDLISSRSSVQPMVIDSLRFLENPDSQLRQVCERLGIDFDERMLTWPAGARESDGVWGEHWYDAVNQSTGFAPPRSNIPVLDDAQMRVADICRPYYEAMQRYAI
ncbi:MAG: hypothetical protein AB8B87_25955 [Granulosicoccus sp.]